MTDRIEIIAGAETVDVSDIIEFVTAGSDGFGLPPIERLTEQSPEQDGVTDKGYRLRPRVLTLRIQSLPDADANNADYWTLRDRLLRLFRPRQDALRLRRTVGAGLVRQLDVHTIDGGRFATKPGQAGISDEVFQLMAPDPTLYDPTSQSANFNLGGGGDGFTVPMPVPVGVGSSSIDQTIAIVYPGSWLTFPLIRINGPITNPVITHQLTGDKLDFTGTSLAAAEWIEIDCSFAKKTVVDNTGANRIAALTNDSDLATFAILDDRLAPGGSNSIRVTGSAANSLSSVDMTYFIRYIGM